MFGTWASPVVGSDFNATLVVFENRAVNGGGSDVEIKATEA